MFRVHIAQSFTELFTAHNFHILSFHIGEGIYIIENSPNYTEN